MKPLFDNQNEITEKIKGGHGILLFLDFDGTISPIINDPGKAKIDPGIEAVLRKIVKKGTARVTIVSGRILSELKEKIKIEGVNFAGNHGLEWEVEGKYQKYPLGKQFFSSLHKIKDALAPLKNRYPEIFVQDKILSISVHYRNLTTIGENEFKNLFYETVSDWKNSADLEFVEGKKVIDLRPKINWNKGKVAEKIRGDLGGGLVIAIGDDTTDEDMFKNLGDGITVKVGYDPDSSAKYYISDISEVRRFLEDVSSL